MERSFDQKLDDLPTAECLAVGDVYEFADAMRSLLDEWEMQDPALLLGLTRLAIERYNARSAEFPEHGRDDADA